MEEKDTKKNAETEEKNLRKKEVERTKTRINAYRDWTKIGIIVGILVMIVLELINSLPFYGLHVRLLIFVSVVGYYLTHAWKIIYPYENGLILRFGKFVKTARPGIHLVCWPFERIEFILVWDRKLDFKQQEVITKDSVVLMVDAFAVLHIADARDFTYNIDEPIATLEKFIVGKIREGIGLEKFKDVKNAPDKLLENIRKCIEKDLENLEWGVELKSLTLESVSPPRELVDAMNAVLTVKEKKKATEIDADAEAERKRRTAKGEADALNLISDAQANRFKLFKDADPELLALSLDTLKEFGQNKGLIFGADLRDAVRGIGKKF